MQGTFKELVEAAELNNDHLYQKAIEAIDLKQPKLGYFTETQWAFLVELKKQDLCSMETFSFLKAVDSSFYPYLVDFIKMNRRLQEKSFSIEEEDENEDNEFLRAWHLYVRKMLSTENYIKLKKNKIFKKTLDILRYQGFALKDKITDEMTNEILNFPQMFLVIFENVGKDAELENVLKDVFIKASEDYRLKLNIMLSVFIEAKVSLNQNFLGEILEKIDDLYERYLVLDLHLENTCIAIFNRDLKELSDSHSSETFYLNTMSTGYGIPRQSNILDQLDECSSGKLYSDCPELALFILEKIETPEEQNYYFLLSAQIEKVNLKSIAEILSYIKWPDNDALATPQGYDDYSSLIPFQEEMFQGPKHDVLLLLLTHPQEASSAWNALNNFPILKETLCQNKNHAFWQCFMLNYTVSQQTNFSRYWNKLDEKRQGMNYVHFFKNLKKNRQEGEDTLFNLRDKCQVFLITQMENQITLAGCLARGYLQGTMERKSPETVEECARSTLPYDG